ncbi:MAG TPA: sigma 54-interacting transcriptional regulator [Kofleriaceae bacterium]|jgi:two-component system NtrC family response regulator
MTDAGQTERQDDSAARLAGRGSATTAHVRVVHGHSAGHVHEIRAAGTTTGRQAGDSSCDIQIDDNRMSRQHVKIGRHASAWEVVDLGSRNGGFVDGGTLASAGRADLEDGSVIRLGDTLLVFRASAPAVDTGADAPEFPGVSPAAAAVRRRIALLAAASGHALILGETGTGKERVARAIAEHRSPHPFVTQNCAELTRELARSELFGHVRGAFSGATHDKPGLVDLAGKGVLFLDEIGELALDVQGDLLRFLEDGAYRPLGASELKHSTARIVAATNVDLDQAVAGNKFRRDLVARLRASNAPLELPPLRGRREDIPRWIRMFAREAGYAGDGEPWTVGALECLLLYPWLENLRELRGVIRALVADHDELPFRTEDLPARIISHRAVLRGHDGADPAVDPTPPQQDPTPAELEDALRRTQGRVRTAARQLGIERRKLYRLCERYGIAIDAHRSAAQLDDD